MPPTLSYASRFFTALTLAGVQRRGGQRNLTLVALTTSISIVGMLALLLTQSRGGLLAIAITPPGRRMVNRFAESGAAVEHNVQVTPST